MSSQLPEKKRSSNSLVRRLSSDSKGTPRGRSLLKVEPPKMSKEAPGTCKDEKYDLKMTTSIKQSLSSFHSGIVWGYSYNKEGTLFATAGKDGKVMVWEIVNGELKKEAKFVYGKHNGEVLAVTFLDGGMICSSSSTNELHIWNATNGTEVKNIPLDDCCLTMKYCYEKKRLLIGLMNGMIICYSIENAKKIDVYQQYDVHSCVTAVDMFTKEEENSTYIIGTLDGVLYILYDYDAKMQLVKTQSANENVLITNITCIPSDNVCYVTYSSNKIIVYLLPDLGFICKYKGMTTSCSVIKPCLNEDQTLLFIGSKDSDVYVFPNVPSISKKSVELQGCKFRLFVSDKKPVIHISQIPNTQNLLLIDSEGLAAIFTMKI